MKVELSVEVLDFVPVQGKLATRANVKVAFIAEFMIGVLVDIESNVSLVIPGGVTIGTYLEERIKELARKRLAERDGKILAGALPGDEG